MKLWLMQESRDEEVWDTLPLIFRSEAEATRCCKFSNLRNKREKRPEEQYRPVEFSSS